jgi:transposase
MKSYSLDLREKVIGALEAGRGTQREIAEMFNVSRSFVQSMVRIKRDRGTLAPKKRRHEPRPKIHAELEQIVRDFIVEQNDATLDETRDYLAKAVGVRSAIRPYHASNRGSAWIARKPHIPAERDDIERSRFVAEFAIGDVERYVFVDEMGSNLAMTRRYGRAPRGQRATEKVHVKRGENVTVIGAGRLSGVKASTSFRGAITSELVEQFAEEVLISTLHRGDIVFLDNLPAHHDSDIEETLAQEGILVERLPTYSSYLNPIEMFWSKIKEHLRKAKARTREALEIALHEAFQLVTTSDWRG